MSERPYHLPEKTTHHIASKYVDQTFEIRVMRPIMRKDNSEHLPVLYTPDANSKFDALCSLAFHLQFAGLCPRFILVAIGYPGGDMLRSNMINLRNRDLLALPAEFLDRHRERLAVQHQSQIEGFQPAGNIPNLFCGAPDFLQFIRSELMPFINTIYRTDQSERGYYGFSGGGCFGLHALLNAPDTFNRYVIGSPGLTYFGEDIVIEETKAFIATQRRIDAKVFLSMGSEEQFEPIALGRPLPSDPDRGDGMVSDFYRLLKILKRQPIAGLELSHRVFDSELHMPGFAEAFSFGMRNVYERPDFVPL